MRAPSPEMVPYLAGNRLRLILLPTEACNFRFVYCYEAFRHSRMTGRPSWLPAIGGDAIGTWES